MAQEYGVSALGPAQADVGSVLVDQAFTRSRFRMPHRHVQSRAPVEVVCADIAAAASIRPPPASPSPDLLPLWGTHLARCRTVCPLESWPGHGPDSQDLHYGHPLGFPGHVQRSQPGAVASARPFAPREQRSTLRRRFDDSPMQKRAPVAVLPFDVVRIGMSRGSGLGLRALPHQRPLPLFADVAVTVDPRRADSDTARAARGLRSWPYCRAPSRLACK